MNSCKGCTARDKKLAKAVKVAELALLEKIGKVATEVLAGTRQGSLEAFVGKLRDEGDKARQHMQGEKNKTIWQAWVSSRFHGE